MILSNVEILRAIKAGTIQVGDLKGDEDPTQDPFNTTSIDLHLGDTLSVPHADSPTNFDLTKGNIAKFLDKNSEKQVLTQEQPYVLSRNRFVLGDTREFISLALKPARRTRRVYGARVEGRSSIARCGILIHFTAPTVHPGFRNHLKLEIINLGAMDFTLRPGMAICQLIFEIVLGVPAPTENQFSTPVISRRKNR